MPDPGTKTCGTLFTEALQHACGEDSRLVSAFYAGFITGQAEKVHLGACMAAMFHPSPDHLRLVMEITADTATRYALSWRTIEDEVWIYQPMVESLMYDVYRSLYLTERQHVLRGLLCGIPVDRIDPQWHVTKARLSDG